MPRLPRLALLLTLVLAGCAAHLAPPGPPVEAASETPDAFVMPDGMRLPYRVWLPDEKPWAVMLALHGMNDSRDAWEIPAPDFAAAGIAVFSPDQRGFGNTATRGYWPGTQALVDDARDMAALLHSALPARPPDPAGREHGRRGADVPGDRASSPAERNLCAGLAGRLEPRGDEPVRARRAVADGAPAAGVHRDRPGRHTCWPATTARR